MKMLEACKFHPNFRVVELGGTEGDSSRGRDGRASYGKTDTALASEEFFINFNSMDQFSGAGSGIAAITA